MNGSLFVRLFAGRVLILAAIIFGRSVFSLIFL